MIGPRLVFVHGWGCGPDIWEPVLEALDQPSACVLDLGYFGASQSDTQQRLDAVLRGSLPVLAVGHSLGFLWLLSRGGWPKGTRFLGINAFGRFAAEDGFSQGVPQRMLTRMQTGLQRDAVQVVNNFRARCGVGPVTPNALCVPALQDGLTELMTLDARPALARLAEVPGTVKVLAGEHDPIVSPEMTQASFPRGVPVEWESEGGHMLPLTHPHVCAEVVRCMMSQNLENS
ncbi:alpha/beta fold hydrolase [Acetobacter sp. P5B1]|uniref:alpha/beta fold hydrolase n=1 Tax=Acetobacter sp. P5B1 TaxID=2762620 RepID=UPI001C05AC5F|nr:alpha/beta hydrolase [Acetobacter sp. P5B1]